MSLSIIGLSLGLFETILTKVDDVEYIHSYHMDCRPTDTFKKQDYRSMRLNSTQLVLLVELININRNFSED